MSEIVYYNYYELYYYIINIINMHKENANITIEKINNLENTLNETKIENVLIKDNFEENNIVHNKEIHYFKGEISQLMVLFRL